jgi:hypothetical protein
MFEWDFVGNDGAPAYVTRETGRLQLPMVLIVGSREVNDLAGEQLHRI